MTKEQAARRLYALSFAMRGAMGGDEGVDDWCAEIERVAAGLAPKLEPVEMAP